MPFDANGNYTLPTIYIAIPGEVIKSTQHNTPFEDVQSALNNTLCRDGRTPWTGNQNANNNKLTGLAKGTNSTDAVRMDQVATLDGEADFTGKVTVQDVDDWTSNEPVPAKQADGRYAKLSGATFYGNIYTSTNVYAGYGSGFGGANSAGGLRWCNGGVGFGNPTNNAGTPLFAGFWTVSDIIGNANHNNSGVNLRGWDFQGNLYNWFLAWNGNITTPKGLVAFQSDVSATVANYLPLSGGEVSWLRVAGNLWALGNQSAVYNGVTNSWVNNYVDNAGNATWDLNGGSPANNTGNQNWLRMAPDGHLQTGKGVVAFQSDLPLDPNKIILAWNGYVAGGDQSIPYPRGVSSVDSVVVVCSRQTDGNNGYTIMNVQGWNNSSVQVTTEWIDPGGHGDANVNYRAILVGNK